MRIVGGLLKSHLLGSFPSGFPEENGYENYVANCVGLEGVLACAALFSPAFVEHDGMIFLSGNVEGDVSNISFRYGSKKKEVEEYNNLICLSEFFLLSEDAACDSDQLMSAFGEVLIYYWKQRLSIVFPDKEFVFILDNDIFDEDGLCLTFHEK